MKDRQRLQKPASSSYSPLNPAKRMLVFLREVVANARAWRTAAVAIILLSAGAVATIITTAGIAAASQNAVLATIDKTGTRTINIYTSKESVSFPKQLVDLLGSNSNVSAITAFGPSRDVRNSAIPSSAMVNARETYGEWANKLLAKQPPLPDTLAWVTATAQSKLGLPAQGGGLQDKLGAWNASVIGVTSLPKQLEALEPAVIIPTNKPKKITTIYITATSSMQVPLLYNQVSKILSDYADDEVTITTSLEYDELRSAINGELTRSTHILTITTLLSAAAATMLVVWAMVILRRKDLGRRRALGANRTTIIALTVAQTGILTFIGTGSGAILTGAVIFLTRHTTIPLDYTATLLVTLPALAATLSVLPASWAARREPIRELRNP